MRSSRTPEATAAVPIRFIVEVEGYDGDDGCIVVENDRADGSREFGTPDKIYCLAQMDADGVVRFNDWGYASADEARRALEGSNRPLKVPPE